MAPISKVHLVYFWWCEKCRRSRQVFKTRKLCGPSGRSINAKGVISPKHMKRLSNQLSIQPNIRGDEFILCFHPLNQILYGMNLSLTSGMTLNVTFYKKIMIHIYRMHSMYTCLFANRCIRNDILERMCSWLM
jgi:hypothetical protein